LLIFGIKWRQIFKARLYFECVVKFSPCCVVVLIDGRRGWSASLRLIDHWSATDNEVHHRLQVTSPVGKSRSIYAGWTSSVNQQFCDNLGRGQNIIPTSTVTTQETLRHGDGGATKSTSIRRFTARDRCDMRLSRIITGYILSQKTKHFR